ncbi:MAG: ATPase [Deltaproteobacteria bacterium]|nr:MAG: ATPase [Deltaproteobacteria bacterium]
MGRYDESKKSSGAKGKKFGHVGRVEDPYLPEEGQEASLCTDCNALYQSKRWFYDAKLAQRLAGTAKVKQVVCPTCRKVKEQYPEGYLTLSGDFFKEHKDEVITLLKNEAARVSSRSVLDRVITMTEAGKNELEVKTTTEKLAQHLGRAVYRAYKGELDFRWSETNPLVRVYWSR